MLSQATSFLTNRGLMSTHACKAMSKHCATRRPRLASTATPYCTLPQAHFRKQTFRVHTGQSMKLLYSCGTRLELDLANTTSYRVTHVVTPCSCTQAARTNQVLSVLLESLVLSSIDRNLCWRISPIHHVNSSPSHTSLLLIPILLISTSFHSSRLFHPSSLPPPSQPLPPQLPYPADTPSRAPLRRRRDDTCAGDTMRKR